jgi:predicted nucleic acid-binding protein
MTRVVVDSSVAIKWFIPESLWSHARRLLDGYETGMLDLLAPDLIYAELGNIVWKKQAVHGLSAEDARQVIAALSALNLQITPSAALLAEAYPLAVSHRRTIYDALYIALSLRERCPFVTADEKLVNAVKGSLSNVLFLADWS